MKKTSERKDVAFEDKFFRLIVVYNTLEFIYAEITMKSAVRLSKKSKRTRKIKRSIAMAALGKVEAERGLHQDRDGRGQDIELPKHHASLLVASLGPTEEVEAILAEE